MMKRLASVLAAVSTTWLTLALVTPTTVASAALDTADTSFPINEFTQLEVHTTANCVLADNRCYFHAAANLRSPEGPTGFPPDLWARQTTTLRSSDRTVYGEGPVENYQINGYSNTTDWATGRPKTDADYIVCAQIQVVYSGVNVTSPSTCAQTTYS